MPQKIQGMALLQVSDAMKNWMGMGGGRINKRVDNYRLGAIPRMMFLQRQRQGFKHQCFGLYKREKAPSERLSLCSGQWHSRGSPHCTVPLSPQVLLYFRYTWRDWLLPSEPLARPFRATGTPKL